MSGRTVDLPSVWTGERPADRHLALGGIVLVAVGLRAYGLGAESLWIDEVLTARFVSELSLGEIVFELPTRDPHPPLYYLLLALWTRIVGVSAVGMRSLSVLLDAGSVVLCYAVATRLYDRRVGLLSAGLFAVSPFYVWYGREARMYALLTFLGLASLYFLLRLVDGERDRRRRVWAGYLLATVGLAYTHALGILVVVAQNVYVTFWLGPDDVPEGWFREWVRLQAVVAVAFLPYARILWGVAFGGGRLSNQIQWIPEPSLARIWKILGTYVGRTIPPSGPHDRRSLWAFDGLDLSLVGEAVTVAAVAVVAYAVVRHYRAGTDEPVAADDVEPTEAAAGETPDAEDETPAPEGDQSGIEPVPLLLVWLVVPILGMFVVSELFTSVLFDRYTAAAGVAFLILLAAGLTDLVDGRRRTLLLAALAVLLLLAPLSGLYTAAHKDQWDEAVATVEAEASPGDLVLVSPGWSATAYDYYATRTDLRLRGIPADPRRGAVVGPSAGRDTVWVVAAHQTAAQRESTIATVEATGLTVEEHYAYTDVHVYRLEAA